MHNVKAIAVATTQMIVRKDFTESEREVMQQEFLQLSFKLAKLAEDKKLAMMGFAAEIAPVQKDYAKNLKALRQGYREVEDLVYLVPNHDEGIMTYCTADGVIVSTRRLRPEEKQENFLRAIATQ
jgi:hypothetical protein